MGDYRLLAYKMIIKPLRGLGEMGLRRFYVYWGCYHSYEAEAEKEVMGEFYEAVDKVPISRREPSDPHWDFEIERENRKQEKKEEEKARAHTGAQDQEQGSNSKEGWNERLIALNWTLHAYMQLMHIMRGRCIISRFTSSAVIMESLLSITYMFCYCNLLFNPQFSTPNIWKNNYFSVSVMNAREKKDKCGFTCFPETRGI